MTKLRALFNVLEVYNVKELLSEAKALGIEAVSCFGYLGGEHLPTYFEYLGREFKDVNVNLFHNPTYRNEPNWKYLLRRDGSRTLRALAEVGINNYPWMIQCNLYGYKWNPLVGSYVHRDKLVEHFNAFYDLAHEVNPKANVILVLYPHRLMNLNCGVHGWKDWFLRYRDKLKFDAIALDAHVGVWIQALTRKGITKRLVDPIRFLQDRGYSVSYVEVGYPTVGYKPPIGWYGWGTEEDQAELLDICYRTLEEMKVPYMQICEFIDPDPKGQIYESFFGKDGKLPRFLGIPVREEAHWGLLRKDRTKKKACEWIKRITSTDRGRIEEDSRKEKGTLH